MKLSRDYDTTGMLLAKQQAIIFSHASEKEYSSYYFLIRFASSSLCEEFDSLAILQSSSTEEEFWLENENTILKNGGILPPDVMHWIGYIYRYWCYVYDISLTKLIKKVSLSKLSSIYEAYHSLSPKEVIDHLISTYNLDDETRIELVLKKWKKIYLKDIK